MIPNVDPELIERAQKGDEMAFEEICSIISPRMYQLAYSFVHDHDDTNEIVQEALIRIYRYLNSLKDVKKFPGWVARIVVNQAKTTRAKGRPGRVNIEPDNFEDIIDHLQYVTSTSHETPQTELLRKEVADDINAAIDQLPPRQKEAIILFEIEGLPIKEVAEIMGSSEGAVKFNIHHARRKLRDLLKQYLSRRPETEDTPTPKERMPR